MNKDYKNINDNETTENVSLDDDLRIKILSPGMLVFKRFIRNKLAITGAIFIFAMFLFAFFGGWIMPYGESQIFTKYMDMSKIFAGVSENDEYKLVTIDGSDFPMIARSQFVLAVNKEEKTFSGQKQDYGLEKLDEEVYLVYSLKEVASSLIVAGNISINLEDDTLGDDFRAAFTKAIEENQEAFVFDEQKYVLSTGKKSASVSVSLPYAIATKNIYDYINSEIATTFEFCYGTETSITSIKEGAAQPVIFTAYGKEFELKYENGAATIYENIDSEKTMYSNVSRFSVQPIYEDVFITLEFKEYIRGIITQDVKEFTYVNNEGEKQHYTLYRDNDQWTIEWLEDTYVVDSYSFPSKGHAMGTDGNGMDLLTRLMYGGRVSLIIGFIVVIIETFIGVILGGIAGYFGKWVDNLIMRIVDIFNSIPSLPVIIIIGAIMDQYRIDPNLRMLFLMIMLAIFGWPGIARLVRGQILSLREREFMIATEATGLSVEKRIFKHLVPNVIPQLIVIATLSLGGVILTESVLSFLGLGVKFPFASWGNIINAVSNVHVMKTYLFVWIPAGFCILITVLGFNFIGDGLRDAFDPKMKR